MREPLETGWAYWTSSAYVGPYACCSSDTYEYIGDFIGISNNCEGDSQNWLAVDSTQFRVSQLTARCVR